MHATGGSPQVLAQLLLGVLLVVLAVQSPPVERRLQRAQRWLPRAFGLAMLVLAAFVAWQGLS